ncbi:MAG: T9SS type A sorting domain-containing protein [Candidatus Kapabacteria bacterium]|jgi:hypothetical protein|nr:T9SS type A sorting domain-containing protein [Candidatus Kapabacteria bacterium]
MKKIILLIVISSLFSMSTVNTVYAQKSGNKGLGLSEYVQISDNEKQCTTPQPFDEFNNNRNAAAISTGYYFFDSNGPYGNREHRPTPEVVDLSFEASNWQRIAAGPGLWKSSMHRTDLGPDGRPKRGEIFFHNPNQSLDPNDPNYDNGRYDSTDNAFAGPMPIGFSFKFGGLDYDSFYVSTNGVITLSNSRYCYDTLGQRQLHSDQGTSYHPHSMDWYLGATRTSDGLDDTTPDDFGFRASKAILLKNGFNPASIENMTQSEGRGAAIIAPFWGKGYLSQWDKDKKTARDWGQVHIYRNSQMTKLIIFYKNYTLIGDDIVTLWPDRKTNNSITPDLQTNEDGYIGCDAQIVLDASQNSISFNYGQFRGRIRSGLYTNKAKDVFRWNTFSGLYNRSRHIDWNSKTQNSVPMTADSYPWAEEDYPQYTVYWDKFETKQSEYPNDHMAVKFMQHKNILRTVDIQYRVRSRVKIDGEYSTDFSERVLTEDALNYELLAGHPQLGQIQPVAIVQNLSNEIMGASGINYQAQDLEFKTRFVIYNPITEKNLYNKAVRITANAVATRKGSVPSTEVIYTSVSKNGNNYISDIYANYEDSDGNDIDPDDPPEQMFLKNDDDGNSINGIPPYGFAEVVFPPFEPGESYDGQIGRLKSILTVEAVNPSTNQEYDQVWFYDDETTSDFYMMRRFEAGEEFYENGSSWAQTTDLGPIPSVTKWVSKGAEIVPGDQVSRHALPPRRYYDCNNIKSFPGARIKSPTIKLNRPDYVLPGEWGGDEIRSFPIDMRNKFGASLAFSVQRTTNPDGTDWTRGWSDNAWVGCEGRVVKDNWYTPLTGNNAPDELNVEFALPSPDGAQGITNIAMYDIAETPGIQPEVNGADRWRYHQRQNGAAAETNMSAFTLFGAGGYMVGFLESNRNSVLSLPDYVTREKNGLRENFYDDGIDYEFTRYVIPIPDTIINAPAEGAKDFRFRIKTHCMNHQQPNRVQDDSDDFYVDNIRIQYNDNERIDLEASSVSVNWPYTATPASQAIEIPITVKITNNSVYDAASFWVKVRIFDYEMVKDTLPYLAQVVYCRFKAVPLLRAGKTLELTMPNWNSRETRPGKYRIYASVFTVGGDTEPKNDTTYSDFESVFGPVFAYEPILDKEDFNQSKSDVGDFLGYQPRGLNLPGYSMGGTAQGDYDYSKYAAGGEVGLSSGQIAMKFSLAQADTIYGYQAFFVSGSMAPDDITIALYQGSVEESTPRDMIEGSEILSRKGWDDIQQEFFFDRYVTYLLPSPVVLDEGIYWVSIAQLGESGLKLGASSSYAGMRVMNYYRHDLNPNDERMNGSESMHLLLDKRFRKYDKNQNLINQNMFAFENTKGSERWTPFMPTYDNPGYGHHGFEGILDDGTKLFARGTWIPLVRPYLRDRLHAEDLADVDCGSWPVELTRFEGAARGSGIDLIWETKSETDNKGFYIEKRFAGDDRWSDIHFENGNGTITSTCNYNFTDSDVTLNSSYQYRLRQVDFNGVAGCEDYSDLITIKFENISENSLAGNMPNPFTISTRIKFNLNTTENVALDILDIYGNVVKSVHKAFYLGDNSVIWDSRDNNGRRVASGTYIYKLTVGDDVMTGKMTLLR